MTHTKLAQKISILRREKQEDCWFKKEAAFNFIPTGAEAPGELSQKSNFS